MAGALGSTVRTPHWVLTYQGVDISSDISAMVLAITYEDCLGGASGTIEVELEDHQKRWQGAWAPSPGDLANLIIGYAGERLLPCGDFQVDDLVLTGPPDVLRLRCLAAYITPAMRTRNSVAYENQTLTQIARTIASKYGLTLVVADGARDLAFARVTQRQETDLAFLRRLAREHNYEFTIRGGQAVFYTRTALEAADAVASVERSDLLRFGFRARTHRLYKAAQVSYQSPQDKSLISIRTAAATDEADGDTLKLAVRCENGQQAALKAASALHLANMIRVTAEITAPGETFYSAGNNLTLSGFGYNDGKYLIEQARHRLDRATGYTTSFQARRVE